MRLAKLIGLATIGGALTAGLVLGGTQYSDWIAGNSNIIPLPPTPELIARGAYLARVGDCEACHSVPGRPAFSGGLKMGLPIGSIYTTNITPDREYGIGSFALEDFDRALRFGVSKGHTLYPAMPFVSYAGTTPDDVQALFAYFQNGVAPASVPNQRADILFPLSMRFPLTIWRWLFAPDPDRVARLGSDDSDIARGEYIVNTLGHCGECHTPRGLALQLKALTSVDGEDYLGGAVVDDYFAPSLRSSGRGSLAGWSAADIAAFLKTGVGGGNTAFGSMAEVVEHSTQHMTDADLIGLAKYVKSIGDTGTPSSTLNNETANALAAGDISKPGAKTYIDNCAACHRPDGAGYEGVFPRLAGNSIVESSNPLSLETIVLFGGRTPITFATPTQFTMPSFAWRLSDQEIADVLTFIRAGWGNSAPAVTAEMVSHTRTLRGK